MDWQTLYLRLSSQTTEFRVLSEQEFQTLRAVLSVPTTHSLADYKRNDPMFRAQLDNEQWLKRLLKFNEEARLERATPHATTEERVPADYSPASREEAVNLGYVNASDVLAVLSDRFRDHASLNRFLERQIHIRTHKPSDNRKMIHAGDLIRQLATESDRAFESLDRDSVQERAQEIKGKRSQARK
jgi:hypothetical protein